MTPVFWAIVITGIILWITVIWGVTEIAPPVRRISRVVLSTEDVEKIIHAINNVMHEGKYVSQQTHCVVAAILATAITETRTPEGALTAYRDIWQRLFPDAWITGRTGHGR